MSAPDQADPAPAPPQEPPASAESRIPAKYRTPLKWAAWLVFAGGLVAAVLGIASLHVEITVVGLIMACTAGLVLLKIRADSTPAETAAGADDATRADDPANGEDSALEADHAPAGHTASAEQSTASAE